MTSKLSSTVPEQVRLVSRGSLKKSEVRAWFANIRAALLRCEALQGASHGVLLQRGPPPNQTPLGSRCCL